MAATNVQAFSGDVEISSNLAVSGSKFTYDNTNTTVFTGTASAAANEIGYLDMSTSSSANNTYVKIYIKYGQGTGKGEAEYSFYIRPDAANASLIYDYRNKGSTITPVVYRTNATDLYNGGTSGVVRFGYSINTVQNVEWRVEVQQRSGNVTFYPTNTGSAIVTTGLVQVTPAPYTTFDSNIAVGGSDLFVDTVNSTVGIGTTNPTGNLQIMSDLANASDRINPTAQLVLSSSLAGLDDENDVGAGLVFTQRWSDADPTSQGTMGSIHGVKETSTGNYGGGLLFKTQPGSDTDPVERMRIDQNGNVGIGVGAPQSALTVYNSSGIHITPTYTVNYTQTSQLDFNTGGGTGTGTLSSVRLKCLAVNRDGGAGPNYDYGAQGKLIFQGKTNNLFSGSASHQTYTDIMTVDGSTHRVGIGSTSPGYNLDVYGAIRTRLPYVYAKNTYYYNNQYTTFALRYTSVVNRDDYSGNMHGGTGVTLRFPLKGVYVVTIHSHSVFDNSHQGSFFTRIYNSNNTEREAHMSGNSPSAGNNHDNFHGTTLVVQTGTHDSYMQSEHNTTAGARRNYAGAQMYVMAAMLYGIQ